MCFLDVTLIFLTTRGMTMKQKSRKFQTGEFFKKNSIFIETANEEDLMNMIDKWMKQDKALERIMNGRKTADGEEE